MPSKRKRSKKAAVALGAIGMSLSVSGSVAGAIGNAPSPVPAAGQQIILNDEEIADVSLGTFYIFDKELSGSPRLFSRGCNCRACRCRACFGGCKPVWWPR
jgi:hypothetical protein